MIDIVSIQDAPAPFPGNLVALKLLQKKTHAYFIPEGLQMDVSIIDINIIHNIEGSRLMLSIDFQNQTNQTAINTASLI